MAVTRHSTGDRTESNRGIKRPLSSGNFLESLLPPNEFEKLIECPVCQDLPLPPIHNCQTGHAICSKCKVKVKECPICKMPYTASRNFLMESIVQTSTFYCNHRDQGCNETGNSEMITDHLDNCTFRPAKCFNAGFNGCKGELVFLSDYMTHLTNVHRMSKMTPTVGKENAFTCTYSFPNYDNVWWNERGYDLWFNSWLMFDEKVFITRTIRRGTKFFFQLAVIAEPTDDAKYAVKVTIANNKFLKYVLTSPVPSIREFRDNGQSLGKEEYDAVSKDLIEKLGQRDAIEEESNYKLTWSVRYKLTKMVDPTVNGFEDK